MGKNAEFVTNMDRMMQRWDKGVDALARLAGNGGMRAGLEYEEGVKELKASREAAQRLFQEIRFASEAEGLELKVAMQAAWVRMQGTLEKLTKELSHKPGGLAERRF